MGARQAGYGCRRCCGCGRGYSTGSSCCPYCGTRAPAAAAAPEEAAPTAPEAAPTPFLEEPTQATPPAGAVAAAPISVALCAFRGANRIDILNLTAGMYFELGRSSNLLLGAVVPLRNVFDRTFDAELAVYYNFMR